MIDLKKTDLCYPEVKLYYISYASDNRNEVIYYDVINTNQCFSSEYEPIDFYNNEQEWIEVLKEHNITPE